MALPSRRDLIRRRELSATRSTCRRGGSPVRSRPLVGTVMRGVRQAMDQEERSVVNESVAHPYARKADDVVAAMGSNADIGLPTTEATSRRATYGPNEITAEPPPSTWAIALGQFMNPMNLMLVAVTVVSFLINEISTGVIVAALILLNVVLGTRQELKARASVDALSKLQVPQAKALRDGQVALIPAVDLVPGDIVQLEAGDVVPADGRLVRSATCETQEAALTGESAPVAKDAAVLPSPDVALGDRSNMLFQNTSVTRGTATIVVTATGMQTQMGQIATMLSAVTRTKSPLQSELDSLTKVLGIIAWSAVALIVVVGIGARDPHRGRAPARHRDGHLRDPDRHAGVRLRPPLARREAARRCEGGGQEPDRRRDARRDERDQHRQDRHAHDEPDDGVDALRERRLVPRRGRGLPEDRRDHVGRRHGGARLHSARARARPRQRRDGRRRRIDRRRSHRSSARRARGEARCRRRGDPSRVPATRRGALRFGVQVHGDVPPLSG